MRAQHNNNHKFYTYTPVAEQNSLDLKLSEYYRIVYLVLDDIIHQFHILEMRMQLPQAKSARFDFLRDICEKNRMLRVLCHRFCRTKKEK